MAPEEPPNWEDVFKDTRLPLMVDIGSGMGIFLLSFLYELNLSCAVVYVCEHKEGQHCLFSSHATNASNGRKFLQLMGVFICGEWRRLYDIPGRMEVVV